MDRGRSWFIACYGSIFGSIFVIVFIVMMIYQWHGYSYFPDWNSFIAGYGDALAGQGFDLFITYNGKIFQFCSEVAQRMISFGNWGANGWFDTMLGAINLLLGGGLSLFLVIVMAGFGGLYIFFLTIPLLSSVTFVLGASITANNLPGSVAPIVYNTSQVGYGSIDYSIDWSGLGSALLASVSSFSFVG